MPEKNGQTREIEPREASAEQIEEGAVFRPNVDIVETPDELTLVVDAPGARPEDVDLDFERGVLTISAPVERRIPEGARVVLEEYETGTYRRTFRISQRIDAEGISAESRNGVLVVHLPKSAEARTRKIPVASA